MARFFGPGDCDSLEAWKTRHKPSWTLFLPDRSRPKKIVDNNSFLSDNLSCQEINFERMGLDMANGTHTFEIYSCRISASGKALIASLQCERKDGDFSHYDVILPLSQVNIQRSVKPGTDLVTIPMWLVKDKSLPTYDTRWQAYNNAPKPSQPVAQTMADLITPKQLVAVRSIANSKGLNAEQLCEQELKCKPEELSKKAASWFLDFLQVQDAKQQTVIQEDGVDLPAQFTVIPGIYTLTFEDGSHRTLKVHKDGFEEGDGKQIVSFLSGAQNDSDYTGFAHLHIGRSFLWKRFKANPDSKIAKALEALMAAGREDLHKFGVAYAQQSGKCYICNRTLTTPESIAAGIGPICAGKTGVEFTPVSSTVQPAASEFSEAEANAYLDWIVDIALPTDNAGRSREEIKLIVEQSWKTLTIAEQKAAVADFLKRQQPQAA